MAQIRHLAISCDHPGKTAEFYKKAFGFKEVRRNGFDPNDPDPDVAPRPCSVMMTDGYIGIALLRVHRDQTGVGMDYQGLHHFGVVVDDPASWTEHLESLGAPNITRAEDLSPNSHWEIKFRGPDNVVFDISNATWPGAAPVDPKTTKQPALEPAE